MFDLDQYNYDLPQELLPNRPVEPRDSSRLFVFDTKSNKFTFDVFRNLGNYLPKKSLLVFNETRVLPARIIVAKETGGKAELLLLLNEPQADGLIKAISDRKINVGSSLSLPDGEKFQVLRQDGQFFFLKTNFPAEELTAVLDQQGITPVPKYISLDQLPEDQLRQRYQSVFAKNSASVAAPTASLHFTDELISKLSQSGIENVRLSLHVGLGTFAPLKAENFNENRLHEETFEIPAETSAKLAWAKNSQYKIVAVGSTVVRTLETSADKILADSGQEISGKTSIFIHPPYEFKIADILITNFHLPKSSLMCMVDAFLQSKKSQKTIVDLYKIAIEKRFRFYSFGDSMLIL
jgi:S-adenosylmethionine:tRNA ribosyltransferase-isomerase